jgi:hypothetical protein
MKKVDKIKKAKKSSRFTCGTSMQVKKKRTTFLP